MTLEGNEPDVKFRWDKIRDRIAVSKGLQ